MGKLLRSCHRLAHGTYRLAHRSVHALVHRSVRRGYIHLSIFALLSFTISANGQDQLSLEQETRIFIDEIKNNNPSSQNKVNFRTGLIQLKGNTNKTIDLNSGDDTMPFLAMEWMRPFSNKWSTELRFLHAQNLLYPANETNETTAFFQTIDLGLRYIFEFSPTRKGNYFAFKTMYHQTTNNFELEDSTFGFLVTNYSGLMFGIERGVTITSRIHMDASLDIMYNLALKEESDLNVKDNGYALFVRGELHYLVNWFKRRGQIGLSYWQAAYTNEFDSDSKVTSGKQNFTTTYRALSFSYSLLF